MHRPGAPAAPRPGRIVRFDGVERLAHWSTAALFLALMLTALPLYFGTVAGLTFDRARVAEIHLWCGIALPVPLIAGLAGPWGRRLRADLSRLGRWRAAELVALRRLGAPAAADKFNPGQKLNAAFTGGAILAMLGTGVILKWYRVVPLSWRTGATFVHDVLAATIFVVVTGHVAFAVTHPAALRSMVGGTVSRAWAARHAAGWLAEGDPGEGPDAGPEAVPGAPPLSSSPSQ